MTIALLGMSFVLYSFSTTFKQQMQPFCAVARYALGADKERDEWSVRHMSRSVFTCEVKLSPRKRHEYLPNPGCLKKIPLN